MTQMNMSTLMFIAALFTIAKTRKRNKCPLTEEWIKKMWCVLCVLRCSIMSDFLQPPRTVALPGSSVHRDSLGKNTGMDCHALLQGLFLTQGLNLYLLWLLHFRLILYHWATRGSPLMDCQTSDVRNKKFYPYSRCSVDNKKP